MRYAIADRESPGAALLRAMGTTLLALALLLAIGPSASAQQICMERADMSSLLGDRFAESRVAGGLSSNGRLVEIYASGGGATWTMVVTTPQGHSCVVASGKAWAGRVQRAEAGPAV